MIGANAYRGQPLVVLALLLGGWTAARAMMWDAAGPANAVAAVDAVAVAASGGEPSRREHLPREDRGPSSPFRAWTPPAAPTPTWTPLPRAPLLATPAPAPAHAPVPIDARPAPRRPSIAPARLAAGHQLMWMAALARLPAPVMAAGYVAPMAAPFQPAVSRPAEPQAQVRRWAGDAWLLLRGASGALAAGAPLPRYGASQAGAVLRYRLDGKSGHRPTAYLRATSAIEGPREKEAALGLAARPLPALPVIAAAELRVTDVAGSASVRPAALAYTDLPPQPVPLGARAETYLQAGYVGGAYQTGFVDGQVRIDRPVTKLGPAELRAGGGAWGGVQRGAGRLDVGPSATISASGSGSAAARLGIDWRFRVAGEAAPASGPAVTLSAGF